MLLNDTMADVIPMKSHFIAYYPLFLVIGGTILNVFTYFILSRIPCGSRRKQATIRYMRYIAIFDILMLYGWNLDHFMANVHGFLLQKSSILLCKLLSFLNYFSAHCSAWLRVLMCFDRYMSLSRLHRKWFNHSRDVFVLVSSIILVSSIFNGHLLIFACFREDNGRINVNARLYQIYPLWDYVNLLVYNCLPFFLMVVCNGAVIHHLIHVQQSSSVGASRIQHRAISMTLVLTTFLFLLMTIPGTVSFAFFYSTASLNILYVLDSMLYTYHILSFPLYLITFTQFRDQFIEIVTGQRKQRSASIQSRSLFDPASRGRPSACVTLL